VVLGNAFGVDEGIVVDTHVRRVSTRLGLTEERAPEKIEQDLMRVVPEGDWTIFSHLLIFHGRRVCKARRPDCPGCVLNDLCPSARNYEN
jgi:endonuclease-3